MNPKRLLMWFSVGITVSSVFAQALSVSLAAQEKPLVLVECPVAIWDDMSALFERGDPLDLLSHVQVSGGVGQPEEDGIRVFSGEEGSGLRALTEDEDFAGILVDQTVELTFPQEFQPRIEQETDGVGLWIQADPYVYLSYYFEDAGGRVFYIPAHRQKMTRPEYAGTPIKSRVIFQDSSAAAGFQFANEAVRFPVRLTGIKLETGHPELNTGISAFLRGVERIRRPDDDQPQRLKIGLYDPPLGHVYEPGQTVHAEFAAPEAGGEIRWKLLTYHDEAVSEGTGINRVDAKVQLDKPGHYRFLIELIEDGKRTDYRNLSLAAIPADQPSHERIAVQAHWFRPRYGLDSMPLLPRIGVQQTRSGLPMHLLIENEDGSFSSPVAEQNFLQTAREKGITGLSVWLSNEIPQTDEEIASFIRYSLHVANRSEGVFDKYEFWNEWSHGTGVASDYPRTPENYVQFVSRIVPELRTALPGIEFVGLGGENPYRFMKEITAMLEVGAGSFFDSLSIHPYRQPFPPEIAHRTSAEPLDHTIQKIADLSELHGGPRKTQITEIGYTTFMLAWGVSEVEQTRYTIRTLLMLHSRPEVDRVYWYCLRDQHEVVLRGSPTSISFPQHGFGLFRDKTYRYAPKPVVVALATYIRETAGGEFSEVQRHGGGLFSLQILERDGSLRGTVLWTLRDPVELQVNGENLMVTDIMGFSQEYSGNTLTVSQDPVYLKGNLAALGFVE